MADEFVEFVVICLEKDRPRGLGSHTFRVAPRKGEIVTMNDETGKSQAYEVVTVVHPLEPASTAGDLYIRYIGTDLDFRVGLRNTLFGS